ncbi:hypothetical protein PR202_ga20743 [Eleusine coracana subsp. coracana]|uniref:Uncharacterized protein n=1 Tax=Eleusine coracana subsp. coracana TaxID=191504 RepID=A0AAV5CXF0_ELECO|nr:hypothetical protein PR202_ga20743 [Eleusine coracana subsp. coracana]
MHRRSGSTRRTAASSRPLSHSPRTSSTTSSVTPAFLARTHRSIPRATRRSRSSSPSASSLSARVGSCGFFSRRSAALMSSLLAAAHGTALGFGLSSQSSWSSPIDGVSRGRWKATGGASALCLGTTGLGGSESSRERTRRMIPSTARRLRPPGTPAVRGLALAGGPACLGGGCLGPWRLGFGGAASAGLGGLWFWGPGPWSHGGGGGGFGDGEKSGRGGGAIAGSRLRRFTRL